MAYFADSKCWVVIDPAIAVNLVTVDVGHQLTADYGDVKHKAIRMIQDGLLSGKWKMIVHEITGKVFCGTQAECEEHIKQQQTKGYKP